MQTIFSYQKGTAIDGCLGGFEQDAMNYVKLNGGIGTNDLYPYISGQTGKV